MRLKRVLGSTVLRTCFRIGVFLAAACSPFRGSHVDIQVDLSAEIQAGRFRPEAGDRVLVAGGFDNWQGDGMLMEVGMEPAVHTARLPVRGQDTLQFRFRIRTGDGRTLDGGGWEPLADRRHAVASLRAHQPVLRYGLAWESQVDGRVTFRVNMANARILGFFDPAGGDRVRLTGAFWNWEDGVNLEPEGDGSTYSLTVPVRYTEGIPLTYRYRIIRTEPGVVTDPWDGWESNGPHSRLTDRPRTDFFNNQAHVLRFIVRGSAGHAAGRFIELEQGGARWQTDALMQVAPGVHEAAIMLPGVSGPVEWRVSGGGADRRSGVLTLSPYGLVVQVDLP